MRRFGIEWLALKKHRKIYEDVFEHVNKTSESVKLLRVGIQSICKKDYEPLDDIVMNVLRLEREADEIARRTMEDLAVSVLTPVDRGDLMNLVFHVEKIAAEAEGLAYRLERAKALEINIPENVSKGLEEVTADVYSTVELLVESINELPSSLEVSASIADKVSASEEKVDVERRKLLEVIGLEFKGSSDFISYGCLMEIVAQLESIADDSEDVADMIRILCVKHSG